MITPAYKSSFLPLLITGVAVILLSAAGIARMMGWGPNSTGNSGGTSAPDRLSVANGKCAECGVIVSMREIQVRNEVTGPGPPGGAEAGNQGETGMKSTRSYEITVRLADGSSRVFNDANPARWRSGERVIVIDGADRSNR
jgi:outer membrane lipoprotein SlyB